MGLEVALLESDPDRGVQILGRTTNPELIQQLRAHLINRLDLIEPPQALRAVSDPDTD